MQYKNKLCRPTTHTTYNTGYAEYMHLCSREMVCASRMVEKAIELLCAINVACNVMADDKFKHNIHSVHLIDNDLAAIKCNIPPCETMHNYETSEDHNQKSCAHAYHHSCGRT